MSLKRQLLAATSLVALTIIVHADAQGQATSPISSKPTGGQAVGSFISDVIKTAFPSVQTIINAIWGKDSNKSKKATDAEPPLTTLQKPAVENLSVLANDLQTVNIYLADCTVADQHLISMQVTLQRITKPTDDGWSDIESHWGYVQKRLAELGTKETKALATSSKDEYVRRSLLAVSDSSYGQLDDIDKAIKAKNAPKLTLLLNELQPKVAGVTAIATDVIGDIGTGLLEAAKTAAPKAGLPDIEEQKAEADAKRVKKEMQDQIETLYSVQPVIAP
jgi:hypothetical protein